MVETLLHDALGWAVAALLGFLAHRIVCLWQRQKTSDRALVALLRDRLVASYCHYHERKTITPHGLQNMEMLYVEYTALGGNGFVRACGGGVKRPSPKAF